jgi:hypothetical protein
MGRLTLFEFMQAGLSGVRVDRLRLLKTLVPLLQFTDDLGWCGGGGLGHARWAGRALNCD